MTFNKNNEESDGSGHDEPWIQWFCGLKGHEMFCEVERSYIEDGFNLYGLRVCVPNFNDCLDLILDRIGPDEDSDDSHLTQSACTLYGLIHARYIITAHGLDAMYNKYAAKEFGTCPLIQCGGQPVLPVSLRDEMGVDTVKIYCPKCSQVFHPPPLRSSRSSSSSSSNNNNNSLSVAAGGSGSGSGAITTGTGVGNNNTTTTTTTTHIQSGGVDGAAFGTTFPHLFLMTFSNLVPDPLPAESVYVPRIFGFRVHKLVSSSSSSSSQRQRYIASSATTATTTSATATSNTLNTTTPNTAITSSNNNTALLSQQQQEQQQEAGDNQSFYPNIGNTTNADIAVNTKGKSLDIEADHDDDDDDDDDNNSQFNINQQQQQQQQHLLTEANLMSHDMETATVPSLTMDHDDRDATTATPDDVVVAAAAATANSNNYMNATTSSKRSNNGSTTFSADSPVTKRRRRGSQE